MEDLNKLKVAELKKILKEKNLSTDGNKATLVQRILAGGLVRTQIASENLDTDEDLILGNDESCEMTDDKKSEMTPAANLATAPSTVPLPTSPDPLTKAASLPSQKKEISVNGKMEERIKRFGVVTDDIKKKTRAERFQLNADSSSQISTKNGITNKAAAVSSVPKPNEEQMKKRAERFGTAASEQSLTKSGQGDALKKRAERFGSSAKPTQDEKSDALLKRKARFESAASGDVSVEAKKQKRAERFGVVSS